MNYAKAAAMVAATVASAIVAALTDQEITSIEWFNIAVAGIGAISVGIVPNLDAGVGKYAKAVVAVALAVVTLAADLVDGGMSTSEWWQLAIAAFGAVGVYGFSGPTHPANRTVKRPHAA